MNGFRGAAVSAAVVAFLITPQSGEAQQIIRSWTADAVDAQTGDIVTILIDELTQASADRNDQNEQGRGRDVQVGVGVGGTTAGGSLRTGNDAQNSRRGESSRRERFQAEMSAQIVEMLPNGNLRIEGRRTLQIDDHEQEVIVRGTIRPEDITSANTIDSWRIAGAELIYDSNEELGSAGGKGIWAKVLDLIIP